MHSDQLSNAILVSKILKIGLLVREMAKNEELVEASTVEKVNGLGRRGVYAQQQGEGVGCYGSTGD